MGIPLEKIKQRNEEAAAVTKKNDKRYMYRENAKDNRRKKVEAAHAEEQATDRKQRCLVEGLLMQKRWRHWSMHWQHGQSATVDQSCDARRMR